MSFDQSTAEFVASKRKRKSPAKLKPAETTSQIPKDLQDQWGAVCALANTFALLSKGMFQQNVMKSLEQSMQFIMKVHEEAIEQALKHPQASMIPELKEVLEERAKADGEKAKA